MDETTSSSTTNGYGKRPLWQWILLYIVIGALIYGLVYYFVFANKGGYPVGPTVSPTSSTTTVSPTAMEASPSSSVTQQRNAVTLTQNGFSPSVVTIKVGQTVTWTNKSGATATVNSDPHPTHTAYPPLNLGSFTDGGTLSLTFTKAGTYGYHNHFNPGEKGTIIVQ
ncbi:MAG TPA: cupredoxin domain-containing protein [Candidatus Eisenbacteria bacterium]|nr:cupredoxin domain-containing protein [Candidatus Eisenbacteria bacterium]